MCDSSAATQRIVCCSNGHWLARLYSCSIALFIAVLLSGPTAFGQTTRSEGVAATDRLDVSTSQTAPAQGELRNDVNPKGGDAIAAAWITGLFGFISTVVGVLITATVMKQRSARGRQAAFDSFIKTDIDLDKSRWHVDLQEYPEESGKPLLKGLITFTQHGSRLVGEVIANDGGRRWYLEGAISERDVCYVYHNANPNIQSFGAAVLTLAPDGNTMKGKWLGRDVETTTGDLISFPITLTRDS